MSRPKKPWLNWRQEKNLLEKLLSKSEGTLHVETSRDGPLNEFVNALRSYLEHDKREKRWVTIQLDPDNSNTRYFSEMIRQIERSLSLPTDIAPSVILGDGSKLGAEIIGGPIIITNSYNLGSSSYNDAVADEKRASRIIETIKARIETESFCFLFVESEGFLNFDLRKFLDLLWNAGLGEFSPAQVLLVNFTRTGIRNDIDWPPGLITSLNLAENFSQQSRDDAIVDLADFLIETGLETDLAMARAYSRGLIDMDNKPASLYAQLAASLIARSISS